MADLQVLQNIMGRGADVVAAFVGSRPTDHTIYFYK